MDFEEKYKRKVDYNIEYLRGIKGSIKEKFDIKKYKEPDDIIGTKELQGINISMSSDGICGIMKIIEYSKENEIIDNYKLIRNKFLVWPSYALSAQLRLLSRTLFAEHLIFSPALLLLFPFPHLLRKEPVYLPRGLL